MKKFVSFALALMMVLSVCATSFAATSCTSWVDTGAVTPLKCTSGGCGLAKWMSVMKGTKQQARTCHDGNNTWTEYRWVTNYGDCC